MSWSVGGTGKPEQISKAIDDAFMGSKCAEPEESIRLLAWGLIHRALGEQDPAKDVQVSAYGSMSKDFSTGVVRNSLNITVTPQG
jgi:hypothetical protein